MRVVIPPDIINVLQPYQGLIFGVAALDFLTIIRDIPISKRNIYSLFTECAISRVSFCRLCSYVCVQLLCTMSVYYVILK